MNAAHSRPSLQRQAPGTHRRHDAAFPFAVHWSGRDLADAVPLRLSQQFAAGIACDVDARGGAPANQPPSHRALQHRYLAALPATASFHIHG